MSTNSKIDMKHGFMKSIIKNQVDRDNYDREVRAKQEDKPSKQQGNKHRKPAIQTYVPPARKSDVSNPAVKLFRLDYEDEYGEVHSLNVHKGEDPVIVARTFGAQRRLTPPLIKALAGKLREEIDKCNIQGDNATS